MSFISYAQNFEDVMLRRALKHVESGFYIDVGAWSPDTHSVTRAFYEIGWRGINIEPNPDFHSLLCSKRPRDINLELAVGDTQAVMQLIIIGDTGLSTLNESIASKHQSLGYALTRRDVRVTTLLDLWSKYVPAGQDVHFLKIDVEGSEKAVLTGCDWAACRPWIIVVESTKPMEQTDAYSDWEPILLSAKYEFVYADGLNRYYLAKEQANLLDSFCYPPNVFDDFVLSTQHNAEQQAKQAIAHAQDAEDRIKQLIEAAQRIDEQVGNREKKVETEEGVVPTQLSATSLSCRVMASLRYMLKLLTVPGTAIRKYLNRAIHRTIEKFQRPLSRLMVTILRYPSLSHSINRILLQYPDLHRQLNNVAQRNGVASKVQYPRQTSSVDDQPYAVEDLTELTPRGLEIYTEITYAIKVRRGEVNANSN